MVELFPHQEEGSRYLLENNGGFLFWKPRVGKTFPTVHAILTAIGPAGPYLFVTKTSIMETWRKALVKNYRVSEKQVGVCRREYTKAKRIKILNDFPIVIINYNSIWRYRAMTAQPWEAIVFDESLAIGNYDPKVTRYVLRKIKDQPKGQFRCALTGTPSPESPLQFATQFFAVDGEFMGFKSYHDYLYTNWEYRDNKWVCSQEHKAEIKKYVGEKASILSLQDLGLGSEILYDYRVVPLNGDQKEALKWAKGRKQELDQLFRGMGQRHLGNMVYVAYENMVSAGIDPRDKSILNFAKVDDVIDYYQENPEPILVLSHFKDILPLASQRAKEEGIPTDFITGDTDKVKAEEIREKFQEGELSVVWCQSKVASEGLDFSKANLTMVISNSFSGNTREQMIMRTTNVNKSVPVGIIDICSDKTSDEGIVLKLNRKEKLSSSFLVGNCSLI